MNLLDRWLGKRASLSRKMRRDWDRRAASSPLYYVDDRTSDWSEAEFFASGEEAVASEILNDMQNICQGKDPKRMRVLEIGCGVGRMTRALAGVFGEVHAVDVSPAMIERARKYLDGVSNAHVYANNGMDLSVLPPVPFDFAFSFIVFQHVPSLEVIENYVREVHRVLAPGGLFKFQVQGCTSLRPEPGDTWVGVPVSADAARDMAERCEFECRYMDGAETQFFRLWFFKREATAP